MRELYKSFLNHIRCAFCVKLTTTNIIVFDESGRFPPSICCHVNLVCFMQRLMRVQAGQVVKSVFDLLYNLHNQGFRTWIAKAYKVSDLYDIDVDSCYAMLPDQCKQICQERVKNYFIDSWLHELYNIDTSIIWTYTLYKSGFGTECYLKYVNNPKYRIVLSKIRSSSHNLQIERGRYFRPKLDIHHPAAD